MCERKMSRGGERAEVTRDQFHFSIFSGRRKRVEKVRNINLKLIMIIAYSVLPHLSADR